MPDDDLLIDYMFLENDDLREELEEKEDENEDLRYKLNSRKTSISRNIEEYDKIKDFKESVQVIAADCGVDMEISDEEAKRAQNQWYTPEDYYEFKMSA